MLGPHISGTSKVFFCYCTFPSFQSTLLSRQQTIQELKTILGKTVQGLQPRERSQGELDQLKVEQAQNQDDDDSSEELCVEIITDKLSGGRF